MRQIRLLKSRPSLPIMIFGFLLVGARIGLITSTWLILMQRFSVNPIISGLTSVSLQGFVVMMKPLSEKIYERISISRSQIIGSAIGATSVVSMLLINNLAMFFCVVLLASVSKVMVEASFPLVTHRFINTDTSFSTRFFGTHQSAILVICALMAPFAMANNIVIPVLITFSFYVLGLIASIVMPECGYIEEAIEDLDNAPQEKFDRRFSDIVGNEIIRSNQSKIHKFRRIPSTLLMIMTFLNIVCGSASSLMALCFKEISGVSQGMDSVLLLVYGVSTALFGLWIIPKTLFKRELSMSVQWKLLFLGLVAGMVSMIYYITFAGVAVALGAAVINGLALTITYGLMNKIAANSLTKNQYKDFGCKVEQYNSISRVIAPIAIAIFASMTSLISAIYLLLVVCVIFSVITLARVILIINARKQEERVAELYLSYNGSNRELQTYGQKRRGLSDQTYRAPRSWRRINIRSRFRFSSHNRVSNNMFIFRNASSLSQKVSNVDSTGGTHRSR